MSEKIPPSNSPESLPTTYWVPRSNGQIDPATLTGRAKYEVEQQRDGKATVKYVEMKLPDAIDENGNRVEMTKMVAEHLLSEGVQASLAAKRDETQPTIASSVVEQPVEVAPERNEYDDLYADDYDQNKYSVDDAADRSGSPEALRQEMLEYADATLSLALRNDTDLQRVIIGAFSQAGVALPKEKEALIIAMQSDKQIRGQLGQYLRTKAEYYRSDLPARVQSNEGKRPNYPGGEVQASLDVATEYAVRMTTGEWDQSREDGQIEYDAAGNVIIGQHRAAARMILMAPSMINKER
jgi:hypothetical protein